MTRRETHRRPLSCARVRVMLEAYLDAESASMPAARLESHVEGCFACREELDAARRVREGLHALPVLQCPDVVSETVLARVGETSRGWGRRLRERIAALVRPAAHAAVWRPALATAGVGAIAVAIALLARQPPTSGVSARDVARAELEAKWALAYVAHLTRRASDTVMEDVIGDVVGGVIGQHVIVPVTDAVRRPLKEERTR